MKALIDDLLKILKDECDPRDEINYLILEELMPISFSMRSTVVDVNMRS